MLAAAGLFSHTQAQAQSFPVVPLSVGGTFFYNTNQTADSSLTSLKTFSANFNSKDLVALLAKSPAVSNVVLDVTGYSGIPAGSRLAMAANFSKFDVIITNKNGFSFALQGNDPVTGQDYSFAGLVGAMPIVSSFNKNITPPARPHRGRPVGTELDRLSVNFFFNDANGDSFSITSVTQIDWQVFTPGTDGSQLTDVSFDVFGSGAAQFGGIPSTVEVEAAGLGSSVENVSDGEFPFWQWFILSQLPPVNT
ncbi:MAG: hypothetical protein P4N60_03490 [Verrucomicrobiae bacterium]|nr:hypothetical protein [Verrucomicrobiae bacterium]